MSLVHGKANWEPVHQSIDDGVFLAAEQVWLFPQ